MCQRTTAAALVRTFGSRAVSTRPVLLRAVPLGRSALRDPTSELQTRRPRRAFSDGASILIAVPSMGDSISEGDINGIHFAVGDAVNMDDVLIEIETDKVQMEVKAPTSGTITEVLVEEGATVVVNQELLRMEAGEGAPVPVVEAAPAAPPAPAAAAPVVVATAPAAAPSHGRTPMIEFRFGCNKGAASASGAASGDLPSGGSNYVDPDVATMRHYLTAMRGGDLEEDEMECVMMGGQP